MIDISEIKDVAELTEMKDTLNFFVNKKEILDVYLEDGKEEWELDLDREQARELLKNVVRQLDRINRPITRLGSKPRQRVPSA
jgi:hypothetical protein